MRKGIVLTVLFCLLGTVTFAHEYNHYSELFAQLLLPVAALGSLACLPLTFLLAITKMNKKLNRLLYGAYVGIAFSFFGILRLLYSYIHNHFELTCQVVAFGFYFSILSIGIYVVKVLIFFFSKK